MCQVPGMWLVALSGPHSTDVKFLALSLTAQLSCECRDSTRSARTRPAVGGRAEHWGEILTAQKKYLPNVPGCSFSFLWKPQGYWVWRVKVQKASRDYLLFSVVPF